MTGLMQVLMNHLKIKSWGFFVCFWVWFFLVVLCILSDCFVSKVKIAVGLMEGQLVIDIWKF